MPFEVNENQEVTCFYNGEEGFRAFFTCFLSKQDGGERKHVGDFRILKRKDLPYSIKTSDENLHTITSMVPTGTKSTCDDSKVIKGEKMLDCTWK